MSRTSRLRRQLNVVEPIPIPNRRHEPQGPPAQELPAQEPPVGDSDEQAGLDAASTGMALLLRLTLRLMSAYEAPGPTRSSQSSAREGR